MYMTFNASNINKAFYEADTVEIIHDYIIQQESNNSYLFI